MNVKPCISVAVLLTALCLTGCAGQADSNSDSEKAATEPSETLSYPQTSQEEATESATEAEQAETQEETYSQSYPVQNWQKAYAQVLQQTTGTGYLIHLDEDTVPELLIMDTGEVGIAYLYSFDGTESYFVENCPTGYYSIDIYYRPYLSMLGYDSGSVMADGNYDCVTTFDKGENGRLISTGTIELDDGSAPDSDLQKVSTYEDLALYDAPEGCYGESWRTVLGSDTMDGKGISKITQAQIDYWCSDTGDTIAQIQEELIPLYGLSDLKVYPSINWDYNDSDVGSLVPPTDTQGILSAFERDLTGDGIPELMTVRSQDMDYILEWYSTQNDTLKLLDSYTIAGGGTDSYVKPQISVKNDRILVYTEWLGLPGASHYGNETVVLGFQDGKINELCSIGGSRSPGTVFLHVNDSMTQSYDEAEEEEAHSDFEKAAMSELERAGAAAESVSVGWGDDLNYGIYPVFEDAVLIFDTDETGENSRQFVDHTSLRDKLS